MFAFIMREVCGLVIPKSFFFLSLAPQPSLGLGLLQKNPAEFLGGFSTIFFFTG
jgi:hypothetical protein